MDSIEAKRILELLAKGVNPATGEIVAADSPLNEREVIGALHFALARLELPAQTDKPNDRPKHAGTAWQPEEDAELLKGFDSGMTPRELATKHGRTRGAIGSRLVKLGRDPAPATTPSRSA